MERIEPSGHLMVAERYPHDDGPQTDKRHTGKQNQRRAHADTDGMAYRSRRVPADVVLRHTKQRHMGNRREQVAQRVDKQGFAHHHAGAVLEANMQSAHQHVLQEQPDHGARDERPRIGAGLGADRANQRNQ